MVHDGGFEPEVQSHHPVGRAAVVSGAGEVFRLGAGHGGHQVHPVGAGLSGGRRSQVGLCGGAESAGHGSRVADMGGEPPGVNPGEASDALGYQEGLQVVGGAPVGAAAGHFPHDHAATERSAALVIGRRDAVVADVGVGEGDDLPGVRRIGDHLLIAGEHGVEHHLAGGDASSGLRANGLALEHFAVGQHQCRLADHGFISDAIKTKPGQ